MKKTFSRIRKQGEMAPAWYYGLAYLDFQSLNEVWYPIPVNYIVRFYWKVKNAWDRLRGKPTREEFYIMTHSSRLAREMAMKYKMEAGAAMQEKFRLLEEENSFLRTQLKSFISEGELRKAKKKHK